MSNENSKLNDLTKLLSDKDVVGGLSENPNNAPEILKEANLTNEEAQDVGNLVTTLKDLSPEELKLSGGNVKESLLKGYHASTAFVKEHWKPIAALATTTVANATGAGIYYGYRHLAKNRVNTSNSSDDAPTVNNFTPTPLDSNNTGDMYIPAPMEKTPFGIFPDYDYDDGTNFF